MNHKIIVIGSSNTDMVVKVPRIPAPGETIMGGEFSIIPGGKGANQAVAAARMGADTTFISCIGDDELGLQSIGNYRKDKINTNYIKVKAGVPSGVALINVSAEGENSITVAPGANSHLFPDDIQAFAEAFIGAKIVLAQLEIPMETVEAAASLAESLSIPFILNPAPGAALSDGLLRRTSILTPNETEAALIAGRKEIAEKDIPAIAYELMQKGVKTVIITLGSKGVYLKNKDFADFIPGYKVNAVDTTAAGDVFNGALASALASKIPILEAINFAQKAAAISVTRLGAQPSAPSLQEINEAKF
jgi:ribokinase